MCEVEELRRTCDIAGSLLLKSPEQELIDWIKQCTGQNLAIKECQQAFYDYFCFPQSGLFCPPYNHVFSNGLRHGDIWQFPAASFEGEQKKKTSIKNSILLPLCLTSNCRWYINMFLVTILVWNCFL